MVMMVETQVILTTLQSEAVPALEDIAAIPFFTAVASGELPLESYIQYLRAEKALIQPCTLSATLPALSTLLLAIEQDLEVLGVHQTADYPRVTLATLSLTEQVRVSYLDNPAKLVGYLFILLEPTLFEKLDPKVLADQFGLPQENGFSFLSSYDTAGPDLWSEFPEDYFSSLSNEAAEASALSAALGTAAGLKKLFQVLYPLEIEKYRNLVMDLNPSAGTHAIPDDPREIQAAIRAGEVTLKQIPYFEWRFGDRAKKFTHSDSAWLAAVTRLSDSAFAQQVDWLAQLLATRGMPQWILEEHLRNLYAELLRFCPENAAQYEKIAKVAGKKRSEREMTVVAGDFSQLGEEFEDRVKDEWPKMSRNAGKILVAAVSDEALDIKNAVASVQGWMTNPARFSPDWIAAVDATLQAARAQVRAN
jgi:heme oxygenase